MSHYFIDKHDPRVADLFRRLEKAGKALDKLESSGGRTLKGERFVTDEELSRLLKISRRTLQEYRTARIIPYYLIQGKVLYMESEIQKLLEDSGRNVSGDRNGYKRRTAKTLAVLLFQFNIVFMPGSCQTTAVVVALRTSHRRKASAFPDFKRKASAAIISSEYSSTIPPSRLRSRR